MAYVQNLSAPANGSQLIANNTYTVSFYNPYPMYESDWNTASDNVIKLIYYDSDMISHEAKTQVVTQGNNAFSFKLADYPDISNTPKVILSLDAYVLEDGEFDGLYFTESYRGGFEYGEPIFYTSAGAPTSPKVDRTVSRDAVTLSWGAGSEGTNNAVTGYDVQYQDSADGVTWPSSWTTASGSPVTANRMNVSPPTTVGYYRRFRVRTRGSAGSDYYSGWVISTNTLRRKWNAFGTWTDPTLSVGGDLRAAHMTEMQERIKTIRSFYGLSAAAFTTITGGVTLAADWADHIAQIRTAIDGITTDHAAWITATAGEPAIAVMNQLRNIIDSL